MAATILVKSYRAFGLPSGDWNKLTSPPNSNTLLWLCISSGDIVQYGGRGRGLDGKAWKAAIVLLF